MDNARLYDRARRSQRLIQASADVTTSLLSGADPGKVLADITRQAQELSGADLTVLVLPDAEGRRLTIACAQGDGAKALGGLIFPADESLSGQVLSGGAPVTSADLAVDDGAAPTVRSAMSHIGPAVTFPLGTGDDKRGVLTIGRRHGAAAFLPTEVALAAGFAGQAGIALELAASRAENERLSVYEDRDRIARDLHDLVIQRLYATAMSLEGTIPLVARPETAQRVRNAVDALDETIREIRGSIFALQHHEAESQPNLRDHVIGLVDEMEPMLGFAPSLRLGPGLRAPGSCDTAEQVLAALREALSNAARHADASRVDVTVDVNDGMLALQVTNDGTGIPARVGRSGLRNLADRAENLGGACRLRAASPGAARPGTTLEWRVPAC